MGFFTRSATTSPVTLPSGSEVANRIAAGSNSLVNKATQVYRNNPKTVGGIALIASALLLSRMKSGRR